MRAYQLYRNAVRLGCRYRFVGALLCVLLLGSLARVLTHSPPSEIKEDSPRFVYQSTQLVAGNGYLFNGRACTELPPGYPVFLAGLRIFLETWYRVVVSQGIISVALSLCLVAVLYKSDRRLGFWAAFLIVVNPWCAYCDWKIMSETLGVSLSIAAIVLHLLLSEASTNMGRVTFGFLFAVVTMAHHGFTTIRNAAQNPSLLSDLYSTATRQSDRATEMIPCDTTTRYQVSKKILSPARNTGYPGGNSVQARPLNKYPFPATSCVD